MHIKTIDYTGFDGPEPEGQKKGTVSLIAEDGRIMLAFSAPPRVSPWKMAMRRRILAKAVSQAMRMPEFRSGEKRLSFETGLLPPGTPPDSAIGG